MNASKNLSPHVLVIDDNVFNLEVLSRMLDKIGIHYTLLRHANTLEEDLPALLPIDVIFLDLNLPKRNGYQAFQELRKLVGAETRIIACTVHASEISEVYKLGFDGFVSKPIDILRFPDQLKRILSGAPVWD